MAESSGEKTEEPTPQRLAEARRRGEVPKSRDLASGLGLAAVFMALSAGAAGWFGGLLVYVHHALLGATAGDGPRRAGQAAVNAAGTALLLPLTAAVLAAVIAGLMQTGGLVAPEALKLDLKRVMPSMGRVFGAQALVEIAKGLLKVSLVGAVAYWTVWPSLGSLGRMAGARGSSLLAALGELSASLGQRLVMVAAALGAADYLWQRHRHRQRLRMSRDEVKREHKESEGDPAHKAERHRLHQELMQQRMVNDVRKADFVVVNPDHIAVAVRYDPDGDAAPVVVAKGERLVAEQIKQVAREAGVPIFRDVTLARSLRDVEEGDEIPEALYEAVAELLAIAGRKSAEPPPARATEEATIASPPGSWTRV